MAGPALVYLALAVAFCWQLLGDPAHRVTAGNPHDHALISYLLLAEPTALLHGHNPLLLTSLNAPDGVNAMWNTGLLLPALVMAPITLTWGGTLSFNLLLVAGLAGAATSAYTVAARITRRRVPAFLAGLVFGFSPAMTHQAEGHLHLVFAILLPPLLAALFAVVSNPFRVWTSVRLGLLAAAQLLTGEEMFACTAIAGAVMLTVVGTSRPRRSLRAALPAARGLGLAFAAFAVLAGAPLGYQFFGPRQQYGAPVRAALYHSDLAGFVTPDRLMLLHTTGSAGTAAKFPDGPVEQSAYLGWPLVVLTLLILARYWRDLRVRTLGVTALVLAVLSLGRRLVVAGDNTGAALPWGRLHRLPLLAALLPQRFGLLVAGLVGLMLALAVDHQLDRRPAATDPRRRLRLLSLGALCVAVLAPLAPTGLRAADRPATPLLISGGLSHQVLPTGSTVLVLPFPTPSEPTAMSWQADDGLRWAMPGGYFVGPACRGRHCTGTAHFGAPRTATASLLSAVGRGVRRPDTVTAADAAAAVLDLRAWQADRVLVGPGPHQQQLVAAVTALLGRSGNHIADCWLWTVR
ncbi:MAG: hypothetical protein QOE76_1494 [Frankiales bacterium]|nr:hypothetical protein [Frankiales bacterium]